MWYLINCTTVIMYLSKFINFDVMYFISVFQMFANGFQSSGNFTGTCNINSKGVLITTVLLY